jgi:hypothetical protein
MQTLAYQSALHPIGLEEHKGSFFFWLFWLCHM